MLSRYSILINTASIGLTLVKIAWGFLAVFFPLVAFRVNHLLFSILAQFPTNLLIVPPSISLLSRGNKQWYQTPFFPLPPVKPQWEVPAYGHLLQTRLASLFCSHMPQSQGSFLQHSSPPAMPEQSKYLNKTYNSSKMWEAPKSVSNSKKKIFIFLTFQPPLLPLDQRLKDSVKNTWLLHLCIYFSQTVTHWTFILLLFFFYMFSTIFHV